METTVMSQTPQKFIKEYDTKIDTKKRITLRGSRYEYYHVVEFPNGKIELSPRELKEPFEISKESLRMMDLSMENFKKGIVSDPLNFSDYAFIKEMEVEDNKDVDGIGGQGVRVEKDTAEN